MPLHVYECQRCGQQIEELQKFSDPPLVVCECSGHLEKLIGGTSFQLKGGGWYKDLYSSSKKNV